MPTPTSDGQVLRYDPQPPVLPVQEERRIYYVNGIQTSPEGHAATAAMMAEITERSVYGVYNQSGGAGTAGGMAADLAQCAADWVSSFGGKVTEYAGVAVSAPVNAVRHGWHALFDRHDPAPPNVNLLVDVTRVIPEHARVALVEGRLALYNKATLSLYRQLRMYRGRRQTIIAHSQGNLITCDALWALVYTYGETALADIRVYSLASPAPGWPLGIRDGRRRVYGHTNDPVPSWFDPHNWRILAGTPFGRTRGTWGEYTGPGVAPTVPLGERIIAPHDVRRNAYLLHFANDIREAYGLPKIPTPPDVN